MDPQNKFNLLVKRPNPFAKRLENKPTNPFGTTKENSENDQVNSVEIKEEVKEPVTETPTVIALSEENMPIESTEPDSETTKTVETTEETKETEDVQNETDSETTKTIETTEEDKETEDIQNEPETVEETTETNNTEEKPKRRRRTKKTTDKTEKTEDKTSEEKSTGTDSTTTETVNYTVYTTEVDFDEAIKVLSSKFDDPEWLSFKEDIEKEYEKIVVEPDINSSVLLNIEAQLAKLRDRIWSRHCYYQTQLDQLMSKEPEGLIARVKRLGMDPSAPNEAIRNRQGVLACVNFVDKNGNHINLYELLDEIRARYNFLNSVLQNIGFKKDLLITISSALKIENDLNKTKEQITHE